ncbi:anti-sigma factor family protein [Silvimonas amylolytica]|uniref:Membrane protein n=1 Tax=Silvimonas amylolytica TaxID=449663 RepID=A0ABQ2PHK5_9NEIS|nr:anti-sigma factor [Silvimonas amylolytica]GGP24726.1 membrane protein [Silvimonas amylolytica]
MNHDEIQTRLSALIDDELPADEAQALRAHLNDCMECREAYAAMLAMGTWIQRDAVMPMPPALAAQLTASLKPVAAIPMQNVKPATGPGKTRTWFWPGLTGLGGLLAGAALMFALLPLWQPQSDLLTQDLLAGHIRALQVDHLSDVISTDQHTVKPWFAGKLDFSPPVHDLVADGFPLAGGRLDYLQQRPVAVLNYRYRLHVIEVYAWPVAGKTAAGQTLQTRQGYQILGWQQEGMNMWAVSDLNGADLQRFAQLLKAAGGAGQRPA